MKYTIGTIKTRPTSISKFCRWYVPCLQDVGSGSPSSISQDLPNMLIGAATSDASIWSNSGFVTSTSGVAQDKGVSFPSTVLNWDGCKGQSLLYFFQVQGTDPGAGSRISGNRRGGIGISFQSDGTGKISFLMRDNLTSVQYGPYGPVFDGATHSVCVYIDGVLKKISIWIDGVITSISGADISANLVGTTNSDLPFGFGHDGNPAASSTFAMKFRNLHAYVKPAVIPNIDALVARLQKNPFVPLSETEL